MYLKYLYYLHLLCKLNRVDNFSFLNAAHTGYFSDLYDQYLKDPDSLEPSWKAFFQGYDFANSDFLKEEILEGISPQVPDHVQKEFKVINLINGYRSRGHLFTKTNPVRDRRTYRPTLSIENFGLNEDDLNTTFNAGDIIGLGPQPLSVIISHLEEIYCDSIGVEYMYIRKPEIISWIQNKLNINNNQPKFTSLQKKKLMNFNPKLKEECGVFGISNANDASALTALGLHALQHRGQEGCGIVTFDGEKYYSEKRFGLVGDNFNKEKVLNNLKGNYAIGHNRYSTTGNNILRNIQPFFADTNAGGIGVAHNGNLTNSIALRNKLVEDGAIFYTTSDTETIVQLIAKSKRPKTIDKVIDAIFQIQGGYALVMLTQNLLVGVRDPYGIRPLVIGKLKNSYVLASETCALDIIGAKFVRDVENGEIVLIENDKLKSIKPFPEKKIRPCVFEYIYFARPDSILNGKTAYEHRKNLGKELAKENDIDADIIVPVPDSGNAAALGFAQHLGKNYEHGLIRNHYVGRTFIEPSQKIRSLGVKLKLNATKTIVKNKSIILTDTSMDF